MLTRCTVDGCGTVTSMDQRKVITAEELEKLPVAERHRLVDESIVTDLSTLDPELVARIRSRGRELLEARGIDVPPEE
jgi:hypothetical protein